MMSNAHGRKHMRAMNNGSLKPCTLDDPEWSYQIRYIINCWNNRPNSATRYPQDEIAGCGPSWYCVKITSVVCAKCATGGRLYASFLSSYLSATVNKMILEISIRAKTRTNERHDETSERGRNSEIQANLKTRWFLRAKYEHMMGVLDW